MELRTVLLEIFPGCYFPFTWIFQGTGAVNITDVPQSGIYYQQGAIVQLVVQLVDIVTGEPIPLQGGAGFSISILYPDLVTSQTFQAQLYTDGSDGMITYITKNTGAIIDLSQVGLYQMQGMAVIGGSLIPPSYATDFYVLKNTFGGAMPTIITPSAIILFDSNGIRWAGTVSSTGVISWNPQVVGPTGFLQFNNLVMVDNQGVYWKFSISTVGVVTGTPGGTFNQAQDLFSLQDINGKSWLISNNLGTLVAS